MIEKILAKRYANALFMISNEKNIDNKKIIEICSEIASLLADNETLRKIIKNPNIKNEYKLKLFEKLFINLTDIEKNIFNYLILKGKLEIIDDIKEEYINLVNKKNNMLKVIATFASIPSEEQKNKIIEKLSKKTGKNVYLEIIINKDILGGVILDIDGEIMDGSLKHHLYRMNKLF